MPVNVNFQVVSMGRAEKVRLEEAISAAMEGRPGRWRVQFIGGTGDEVWEMRVSGPGVEDSQYLDRAAGELEPDFVASLVQRITGS